MSLRKSFLVKQSVILGVGVVLVLGLIGTGILFFRSDVARAATTVSISTVNLYNSSPNAPIKATSTATAVVRINATTTTGGATLQAIAVAFGGNVSTSTDLMPILPGAESGVALYNDAGSSAGNFDATDAVITLSSPAWNSGTTTITLTPATPVAISSSTNNIFFIVIKTAGTAVNNHQIIPVIAPNTVITSDGNGPAAPFMANNLLIDSVSATSTTGGPTNGQIGVPIDAFVDRSYSEALATTTVTTSSVILQANNPNTAIGTPSGNNLCIEVNLTGGNRILCNHMADMQPLATSTWYTFTVSSTSTDIAGNPIVATSSVFQTGSFNPSMNMTPPMVMRTMPNSGAFDVAVNTNLIVEFPQGSAGDMQTSGAGSVTTSTNIIVQRATAGQPTGQNICAGAGCVLTWDSGSRKLKIDPASNFATSSEYILTVKNTVKNQQNIGMPGPDFIVFFRTGSGSSGDSSAPTVESTEPNHGMTNVPQMVPEIMVKFSKEMDETTLTSSTVQIFIDANANSVKDEAESTISESNLARRYDSMQKALRIGMKTLLNTNTRYCVLAVSGGSGVKDIIGNALASNAVKCFTTSASSFVAVAPRLTFADADNFKLWIEFDQPVNASDAVNKDNYTIESPVGTQANLTNATLTYRPEAKAVEVTNIGLQTDNQFKVTVTGIRDLSGNTTISNDGIANVAKGMILNSNTTGGFIGGFDKPSFDQKNFGTFWEKPERCAPRSLIAEKTTTLECEFPTPSALTTGSTIILTFPTGFSVGGVTTIASSTSFMNKDLDGPGPGVTTISGIATSTVANTVTLTLTHTGDVMGSNDRLRFELQGLINPQTTGEKSISIVVKDSEGIKRGQTINPAPFMIQTGGNLSISGKICKGSSSGGVCGEGDTGIANIKVFLDSFGGFGASGAMGGHSEATTNGGGVFTFSSLSPGKYGIGIAIDPSTAGDIAGGGGFQEISLENTSKTGADFKFVDLSSTGKTLTVSVTGGPASTDIDVFCHAPGNFQFSAPVMKQFTTDSGGAATTTLKLQPNTKYECGIGPHVPFDSMNSGGPPPVPEFTFMPPPPQTVVVKTVDLNVSFALAVATHQVIGKVTDNSGTGIANMFVDARPLGCFEVNGAKKDCQGGFSQTKSDGTFTLNVTRGTYQVGACGPGMPCSPPSEITVKDNDAGNSDSNSTADIYKNGTILTGTGLIIKLAKSDVTVAGQVQDENGNGIKFAFVNAEKIQAGGTCTSFTPAGGFTGSPTDSQGNYTLYASNGTWRVNAFAPAYGEVGCSVITVSDDTSKTGQDIKATATDYGTIQGTVTKASTAVQGANVACFGSSGGNGTISGTDGSYSIKVKSGTYSCEGFLPGAGPLTPQTNITVLSAASTTVDLSIGEPATITVALGSTVTDAFCDARNAEGRGHGTSQNDNGTYTMKVPAGTYTVRCGHPKYGELGATSTTVTASGSASISFTPPTLYTISGRVTDGTNNLEGGGVVFTDSSNGRSAFISSSAASGSNNNVSISLPAGTYGVSASKSGYVDSASPQSLTISTSTSFTTRTLTKAGATASITVQAGSSNYTGNARVIASNTDGKVVTTEIDKAITSGANVTLPLTNGTWTVQAFGDNGKKSATTTITVTSNTPNSSPTLSLATDISGFTARESKQQSITPKSGGLFKDTNIGSNFEVNIPSGVLSTSDSSSGSLETKLDPSLAVSTPGKQFIGKSAIQITPKDSSGKEISSLAATGESVTLKIPYTDADVTAAGVEEEDMVVGVWSDTTGEWETLPTTVDTTNNILIAQTKHFSTFAPIAPVGTSAPGIPTGLSATTDGTSQIRLNWTQVSGATGYDVYRSSSASGTFGRLGNEPTIGSGSTVTYQDTGLSSATTYYYKLSATNATGESTSTSAVSAMTGGGGGGGTSGGSVYVAPVSTLVTTSTATTTTAVATSTTATSTRVVAATSTTATTTLTATTAKPQTATSKTAAKSLEIGNISFKATSETAFTKRLVFGAKSDDVSKLQEILAEDEEIYPEGTVSGYFGALTKKAVQKFQEKYEIAKPGDVGYGEVGPNTRAKLNEIVGGEKVTASKVSEVQQKTSAPSSAQSAVIAQVKTQIEKLQEKVAALMIELAKQLTAELQAGQ